MPLLPRYASKSQAASARLLAEAKFRAFCKNLYAMLYLAVPIDGVRRDDAYINHIVELMTTPGTKFSSKTTTETIGKRFGITDMQTVKELTEYAIVKAAKKIIFDMVMDFKGDEIETMYWRIVELYENQPYSTYRSSTSVALQQYSTPIPFAFLMDRWVKIDNGKLTIDNDRLAVKSARKVSNGNGGGYKSFKKIAAEVSKSFQDYEVTFQDGHTERETVHGDNKEEAMAKAVESYRSHLISQKRKEPKQYLEPTAGNGMLVFDLPAKELTVNELDITRLGILYKQDLAKVLNLDANQHLPLPLKSFDGIISNPPFGTTKTELVMYGWSLRGLEAQILARSLEYMKDDGRAAFIIGGHTEFNEKGQIEGAKDYRFLNYLAHFYNLADVVNVEGDLYFKQGTRVPVRIILVNGRKPSPSGYYPIPNKDIPLEKPFSIHPVTNWKQLFQRIGVGE